MINKQSSKIRDLNIYNNTWDTLNTINRGIKLILDEKMPLPDSIIIERCNAYDRFSKIDKASKKKYKLSSHLEFNEVCAILENNKGE